MSSVDATGGCARRTIPQIPVQHIMKLDLSRWLFPEAICSPKGGRDHRHVFGPTQVPSFLCLPSFYKILQIIAKYCLEMGLVPMDEAIIPKNPSPVALGIAKAGAHQPFMAQVPPKTF